MSITIILKAQSQLGFCPGNSGDPIFSETFGTGIGENSLPPGTTTYNYSNEYPLDGSYTVSNGTYENPFDWHEINDHTVGDNNGKFLIVNADTDPGGFYGAVISGLCPNTTYEFSSWLVNLVKAGGFCSTQSGITIPVNVSFEIWDASNSTQLASGTTGDIPESTSPNWLEYGLIFQTLPGQSTVILKMVNNGNGGCGNDLAIDDIEFKSCGDVTTVTGATNNTSVNVCSSLTPFSIELTATPDFSVYSDHFYQWQESSDGNLWDDILGETNQSILVTVGYTGHYRTKVAESASNLDNPQCISFSNEFIAGIISAPFLPTLECWETAIMNATTCSWEISGTQPEQPVLEQWETSVFNTLDCIWDVSGTPPFLIMEEYLELCTDSELELIAYTDIETPDFAWSSGEITKNIKIEEPGVYSVDITNGVDSFQTIIFNVNYSENPMIDSVISNQDSIIIKTVNSGDFLYSLDDIVFQSSNIFYNVEGGIYTIGVKNKDCDFTSRLQHLHFYVPKFFTPNMDGINDTFNLFGIQNYSSSQVAIFDRYGKLLVFSSNSSFEWDGTYNNQIMPSGDYWYWIIVEGHKITGHVNMKR